MMFKYSKDKLYIHNIWHFKKTQIGSESVLKEKKFNMIYSNGNHYELFDFLTDTERKLFYLK